MEKNIMELFSTHTGIVGPLDQVNIDTDQIMPKQFLKRIERTGYGPSGPLFEANLEVCGHLKG